MNRHQLADSGHPQDPYRYCMCGNRWRNGKCANRNWVVILFGALIPIVAAIALVTSR